MEPCLIRGDVARVDDIIAYQANNCDFTQFKHTEDASCKGEVFCSTSNWLLTVEELEVLVLICP